MVYRIIYSSTAQPGLSKSDIENILETCRTNNSASDITGVLFYCDGEFIQVLEGDRAQVRDLYDIIAKDPRHANIEILIEENVDARYFSQWAMAYAVLDENDLRTIGGSFDLRTFRDFKSCLQRPDAYVGGIFADIIDRILSQ